MNITPCPSPRSVSALPRLTFPSEQLTVASRRWNCPLRGLPLMPVESSTWIHLTMSAQPEGDANKPARGINQIPVVL